MKTVTAAIILDGSKVLIARRGPNEKLAGFWEFPGGKVENEETLQECLERELLEELGIRSRVHEVIAENEYHYGHGAIRLVGLRTEALSGQTKMTVHDAIEWVDVTQLTNFDLAPADVPIAIELQRLTN
jgi:8-oxo-dGTP diphosphatase